MATADVKGAARSLWGKQGEGRNVYEAALARTRFAFDNFDHLFVSFSGGKDSTAVLNVALEVARERDALPLRVVFFDEECISIETVEYAERVAALPDVDLEWYCLPVRHRNACSAEDPYWFPWAPEDRDRWVRPLPPEAITAVDGFPLDPDERYDIPTVCERLIWRGHPGATAGLLGIRADESITRRKAVSNKRPENFVIPTAEPRYSKVYPVYDWRTADIWRAPASLGWDYNATYDIMEMAGITAGSQRCAPPFGEEPMQNLWMWAECFPDLWDRMCERVPGAAAAARYSRTELYAFNERVEKPADLTWEEFILRTIEEHAPEVQAFIAHKIRTSIKRHHSKTADPLVIGLGPASPSHVNQPAFYDTRSGARLAGLCDVDAASLLDAVDTLNLSGDYVEDWPLVPPPVWRSLAVERVLPAAAGRVVIACGRTVAGALGISGDLAEWGAAAVVGEGPAAFLALVIPHPAGLSDDRSTSVVRDRCRLALRIARTLARCGPVDGTAWSEADAAALNLALTTRVVLPD